MTTATAPTGVRLPLASPGDTVYMIRFGNDNRYYTDPDDGVNAWPWNTAKAIARNVAKKRSCITVLVPHTVEEPVDKDSDYDRILHYVDGLKGASLSAALVNHYLVQGRDAVASKRERLIAHLLKPGSCVVCSLSRITP